MNKEDFATCKAITPDDLFGYSNDARLQKLDDVETVLSNELKEIKKKCSQVQEAAKRARGNEEK